MGLYISLKWLDVVIGSHNILLTFTYQAIQFIWCLYCMYSCNEDVNKYKCWYVNANSHGIIVLIILFDMFLLLWCKIVANFILNQIYWHNIFTYLENGFIYMYIYNHILMHFVAFCNWYWAELFLSKQISQ